MKGFIIVMLLICLLPACSGNALYKAVGDPAEVQAKATQKNAEAQALYPHTQRLHEGIPDLLYREEGESGTYFSLEDVEELNAWLKKQGKQLLNPDAANPVVDPMIMYQGGKHGAKLMRNRWGVDAKMDPLAEILLDVASDPNSPEEVQAIRKIISDRLGEHGAHLDAVFLALGRDSLVALQQDWNNLWQDSYVDEDGNLLARVIRAGIPIKGRLGLHPSRDDVLDRLYIRKGATDRARKLEPFAFERRQAFPYAMALVETLLQHAQPKASEECPR